MVPYIILKIQEAGGVKLARMFSTDLSADEPCGRKDCQPCTSKTGRRQNCKKQSVLYESKCKECNPGEESSHQEEKQPSVRQVGETSRSLFGMQMGSNLDPIWSSIG